MVNKFLSRINPITLIRIGLGFVFLANSLTAFFAPAEFAELIEKSFLSNILPVSTTAFVTFIGINDAIIATLLLLNIGRKWLPVWAAFWIIGVVVIKGISLDTLEESGFLFMALTLIKK